LEGDDTLMPGAWYGGQLHLAPPTDQAGAQKSYTIVITVGSDRYEIEVAQGPAGKCGDMKSPRLADMRRKFSCGSPVRRAASAPAKSTSPDVPSRTNCRKSQAARRLDVEYYYEDLLHVSDVARVAHSPQHCFHPIFRPE
jgi:hypothetical protein